MENSREFYVASNSWVRVSEGDVGEQADLTSEGRKFARYFFEEMVSPLFLDGFGSYIMERMIG